MPTELQRRAGVVGSPVAHSLSPVLHLAAYRELGLTGWSYERLERDADGLRSLVAELDQRWVGLSVTMPGKVAALEVAVEATERALAVGAANTLVHRQDGAWRADCTDVDGVVGAVRAVGFPEAPDSPAVVLGAGGTARAALAGLVELGVPEAVLVVREPARADAAVRCAKRLALPVTVVRWADADFAGLAERAVVLVNTAPVEAVAELATDLSAADRVLDVIYHPWPTPLAEAVGSRGGRIATGLDMLLHQAFGQVEQFTGQPAPRAAMRTALRQSTGHPLH